MPHEPVEPTLSAEDRQRLTDLGALAGDSVVLGYASDEDAVLRHAEHQREWVEKLLPCLDGVHAVIESGPAELLVACAGHTVPAVLATLLEQGFVGVLAFNDAFAPPTE